MSSIRLSGSTSGHYDLTVPAVAGTNSIDLSKMTVQDSNGNITVSHSAAGGAVQAIVLNSNGVATVGNEARLHLGATGTGAHGSVLISEFTGIANTNHRTDLIIQTTPGASVLREHMRIDGDGRVTTPHQPYFYAGGTNNGFVNNNKIPFNSAAHNIGNHYNTSNYTFTAPITGKYLFTCSVLNYPGTQSGGEIFFSVNGSTTYSPLARWYTITQQESITLSAIKLLNANDTLTVRGTLDAYVTSGHGHFSGMLLG